MKRQTENELSAGFMVTSALTVVFLLGYMVGIKFPGGAEISTLFAVMMANVVAVLTLYRFRRRRGF